MGVRSTAGNAGRAKTPSLAPSAQRKARAEKHAASGVHPGFVRYLSGLASGIGSRAVRSRSAVGFAAVADGGDRDGVLVFEIEEHAVVATTETEAGKRRFELLHVAGAVSQVAIY